MKKFIKPIIPILDWALAPAVLGSALVLRGLRQMGLHRTPLASAIMERVGVLPVYKHYYEPFVSQDMLHQPLDAVRDLPGIDFNAAEQLELLSQFCYQDELRQLPWTSNGNPLDFYCRNGAFESGDVDYLYSIIRRFRPARILEIGAGMSTLLIRKAVQRNKAENASYACDHVCVEPYERAWLEQTGARVLRQRVETLGPDEFDALGENDILFIDSTHIICPQGDVLFEYLQVLPRLKPGVLVHIHDVFTPRDYPADWVLKHKRLWNEQYLLEAFLSCNDRFRIIAAVNYLSHEYPREFSEKCAVFAADHPGREPGSFWLKAV